MLGLGEIFTAGLFVLGVFVMSESYQWLSSKGVGEARRLTPHQDDTVLDVAAEEQMKRGGFKMLFSMRGLKYLAMSIVLAATLQLTGINAVMYYGPKILENAGMKDKFLLNIAIGGWNFLTTIAAIFLVDRVGRRTLMIGGVAIMSVSLAVISCAFFVFKDGGVNLGIMVGIGLLGFIAGFEVGPGCLFWVIANEYFPQEMKEAGASLTNLLQWAFNLFVVYTFLLATLYIGSNFTFGIFAGVGVFCCLYLFFGLSETRVT
jgi:MFS family permease